MINILTKITSTDSSQKLILELKDKRLIESVVMPTINGGNDAALCISVQVGCAVGCTFCKTGQDGLIRNLSVEEIVEQLTITEQEKDVSTIVFMGMGDSAHNSKNVLKAFEEFVRRGKIKDKIFISTIGTHKFFDELESTIVKPRLAISLHSVIDSTRKSIIPMANLMSVNELIQRSQNYAQLTNRKIMYQLTLLDGVNDTDEEIAAIIDQLTPYKQHSMICIIPWNTVPNVNLIGTKKDRINEILHRFTVHGFITTERYSFGKDINAACGQLSSQNYNII
jgi:23S rRNA (adenine2503-C2)-methyltransferase